ncbi:hypothetical protein LTR05_001989 [Lithohypha guttulata]|uniref:Uncharacterized protein n=1 Tax=Lithohypha guttulata TaxID=1690604 RepID=A0AAN7T2T2_9EURO|nr:hypothetical protein LTR05_001989 [Lithohypha guttulata]
MSYLSNANAVSPLPLRARSELTTKLYRLPEQPSELHERCVFWMWHVVVHSWRAPAGGLEEQGRVLKQEQEARFHRLYQNGQAKQVLQDFSWYAKETLPEQCNSDLLKQLDEAQTIINDHCSSFV